MALMIRAGLLLALLLLIPPVLATPANEEMHTSMGDPTPQPGELAGEAGSVMPGEFGSSVSAGGEFPMGRGKSKPFNDPVHGRFLPANEAFRASAWRDDERVYVGFINAEDYYLHRHQFAFDSRDPGVSFGELALPPGELMMHASLGEIYVFYDRVVISAPIEATQADTKPLAITVSFQGCSDQGLCYPPEQIELEAFYGSPPAAFAISPLVILRTTHTDAGALMAMCECSL